MLRVLIGGFAAILVLAGCQHATPTRTKGESSFSFVKQRPDVPSSQGSGSVEPRVPVDVILPAAPVPPLTKPVYPAAALGRQQGPIVMGVRLSIDESGRVVHVGPSLMTISTSTPFADEFRAAIEYAVAQWRFTPAGKQHLVPHTGGPGGEDYWVVTASQLSDYAIDVAFTFKASGDVTSGLTK